MFPHLHLVLLQQILQLSIVLFDFLQTQDFLADEFKSMQVLLWVKAGGRGHGAESALFAEGSDFIVQVRCRQHLSYIIMPTPTPPHRPLPTNYCQNSSLSALNRLLAFWRDDEKIRKHVAGSLWIKGVPEGHKVAEIVVCSFQQYIELARKTSIDGHINRLQDLQRNVAVMDKQINESIHQFKIMQMQCHRMAHLMMRLNSRVSAQLQYYSESIDRVARKMSQVKVSTHRKRSITAQSYRQIQYSHSPNLESQSLNPKSIIKLTPISQLGHITNQLSSLELVLADKDDKIQSLQARVSQVELQLQEQKVLYDQLVQEHIDMEKDYDLRGGPGSAQQVQSSIHSFSIVEGSPSLILEEIVNSEGASDSRRSSPRPL